MGVSLKPSTFVEGGIIPVDRNVTWKTNKFVLFNYTKKDGTIVATTTAAEIVLVDDEGQEYVQDYSVGDPERFLPSEDGKTLVAVGGASNLSTSSNFSLLMNALKNAGFPENRMEDDITTLDGLYTYNIGMPEPKRAGLAPRAVAAGETPRERLISVPSTILRLPWEKGKGKAAAKTPTAVVAEEVSGDVSNKALAFVATHLGDDGSITKQNLAVAVFRDLGSDPDKNEIVGLLYKPEFSGLLAANGYTVTDTDISKA